MVGRPSLRLKITASGAIDMPSPLYSHLVVLAYPVICALEISTPGTTMELADILFGHRDVSMAPSVP